MSENKQWICTSEEKDENHPKRVLYYLKSLGRRRVYRRSFHGTDKEMVMFKYKRKKNAQDLCDYVNKVYNDNFKVEEIN